MICKLNNTMTNNNNNIIYIINKRHHENQNLPRAPVARPRSINGRKDSMTDTVPPYPVVMPSNPIHDPANSEIPPSSPG